MKKFLILGLSIALLTTACQKQDEPTTDGDNKPLPAVSVPSEQAPTLPTDDDHHDHDDEHEHHHHEGKPYKCDNDKTINIAIHDHEGETEAHATIDDVEYDLHPAEDGKTDIFVSQEDGINGKGMKMVNEPDGKVVFKSLDDKETLLTCNPA